MLSPAIQLVSHKWLMLHTKWYMYGRVHTLKSKFFSAAAAESLEWKREHSHDSISKCSIQPSSSKVCIHIKDHGVFSTCFRSQGTHVQIQVMYVRVCMTCKLVLNCVE